MPRFLSKERLGFLSSEQKTELSRYFKEPSETAMPHQLAVRLGIEYSDALAILSVLEAEGLCEITLLIYHICAEVPVAAIPFGKGFPNLPWVCLHCEEIVVDYKYLSFDVIAKATEAIEFV